MRCDPESHQVAPHHHRDNTRISEHLKVCYLPYATVATYSITKIRKVCLLNVTRTPSQHLSRSVTVTFERQPHNSYDSMRTANPRSRNSPFTLRPLPMQALTVSSHGRRFTTFQTNFNQFSVKNVKHRLNRFGMLSGNRTSSRPPLHDFSIPALPHTAYGTPFSSASLSPKLRFAM